LAVRLSWGVLTGQFSAGSFKRLLDVSSRAAKIRAWYERFPEEPAGFEPWQT
jgi:hypothetical protein